MLVHKHTNISRPTGEQGCYMHAQHSQAHTGKDRQTQSQTLNTYANEEPRNHDKSSDRKEEGQ